jgi:Uma2 family endonuclease
MPIVPPENNIMVTTRLYTADDLVKLEESGAHFELIEGVLYEVMSPNPTHAFVVANLSAELHTHVRQTKAGRVYAGDPLVRFKRDPDLVLAPDVAFVAADRLPLEESAYMVIAPDLAIEVVSPGNSAGEIKRKVGIYLEGGVKSVWIVYPEERRVVVYSTGGEPRVFDEADEITGDLALPELSLHVAEIFDD